MSIINFAKRTVMNGKDGKLKSEFIFSNLLSTHQMHGVTEGNQCLT